MERRGKTSYKIFKCHRVGKATQSDADGNQPSRLLGLQYRPRINVFSSWSAENGQFFISGSPHSIVTLQSSSTQRSDHPRRIASTNRCRLIRKPTRCEPVCYRYSPLPGTEVVRTTGDPARSRGVMRAGIYLIKETL